METKHTPGKWFANGSDTSLATRVEDANGKRVCTMRQCEVDWERAQLIAQAPALLAERNRLAASKAALVEALETIANSTCDHGPGFCARDFARAALAKANKQHQSNDKEC